MKRENLNHKLFSRRLLIFGGIQASLFGLLGSRMYYLQVVESEQYKLLAEENRINLRLLSPPRGRIIDRLGNELAGNQRNYRIILVPEQSESVERTLESLGTIFPLDSYDRNKILREVKRRKSFIPVTVAENLTWEEFSKVNVYAPELPGVHSEIGETRNYPHGNSFSHIIGYVGVVSQKDLNGEPLLELPGFRIGKSGIEKSYEHELRGKAGISRVEVNAYGRVIREINRAEGDPGRDIELTIDSDLQNFVSNRLGNESASAVVMNVNSGEILAMVSNPSFNPHSFNIGISHHEWERLLSDPKNPLLNKAIGGQYPPGSTFKMIVALAALEYKAISFSFETTCEGHVELGQEKFHCWKTDGHGRMSLLKAIEQSCDVFFYEIARRVGIDAIAEMAKRFGLGKKTGINIPSELRGNVPTRKWKKEIIGDSWQQGETLITGIGQGYVLATPLQLAQMMARLSNGGFAVKPKIIRSTEQTKDFKSLEISSKSLGAIYKGMDLVSNSPFGTAFKSRLVYNNWKMVGKTGTSQVRRISEAERETRVLRNEERPWAQRDHALFVASAPLNSPRYSLSVVVEHGGSGSSAAAPIARDILKKIKLLEKNWNYL